MKIRIRMENTRKFKKKIKRWMKMRRIRMTIIRKVRRRRKMRWRIRKRGVDEDEVEDQEERGG